MSSSAPEIPRGEQSGEVGLYTFFYIYNLEKGEHCDRWICDVMAVSAQEAKEKMLFIARITGLHIDERFLSTRFMLLGALETNVRMLNNLFLAEPQPVIIEDKDMTMSTEVAYQQRIAKNSLIKTLIDAKNLGLYERHKHDLSDEERLYVLNKIR
jgi:hypothetical protein